MVELNKSYQYMNGSLTPVAVLAEMANGNRIFEVVLKRTKGTMSKREMHEVHIAVLIDRYKKWLDI